MEKRVRLRRLTKADFEGLLKAHDRCVTITSLLNRSSWGQAPAVVQLVGDVDGFICELFNKAEASLQRALGVPIEALPGESSPEIPAAAAAGQEPEKEGS
jgi:hypothetical protein